MNDNHSALTSLRTNALLRNLALTGLGFVIWAALAFGWTVIVAYGDLEVWEEAAPSRLQILTAYLLPVVCAVFVWMLVRIARQGEKLLSQPKFWIGCVLIAGAAVLDVGVTFYFSPDLSSEGNPVVRALLDSGHSVVWVMAHMVLTTLAIVGAFCAFWGAFLSHQKYLLETIRDEQPANWTGFLKAATGGAHLTLRQWLFPCRLSEISKLYHAIWMAGIVIVFGISIFRYYVSLEWLGVFKPALLPRLFVLFTGMFATLVWYFASLYGQYQRMSPIDFNASSQTE